jgi:hypothetical protein
MHRLCSDLKAPEKPYVLGGFVGNGAFGKVYRVTRKGTAEALVVKILPGARCTVPYWDVGMSRPGLGPHVSGWFWDASSGSIQYS